MGVDRSIQARLEGRDTRGQVEEVAGVGLSGQIDVGRAGINRDRGARFVTKAAEVSREKQLRTYGPEGIYFGDEGIGRIRALPAAVHIDIGGRD